MGSGHIPGENPASPPPSHMAGGEGEEGRVKQVFVWLLSYELSSKHILRSLPVSGLCRPPHPEVQGAGLFALGPVELGVGEGLGGGRAEAARPEQE